MSTDVSEEHVASIFSVEDQYESRWQAEANSAYISFEIKDLSICY
jgi:hypothetical protein